MKLQVLFLYLFGAFFTTVLSVEGSPQKDFYEAINNGWKNQNDANILTAINNRLIANSDDILALSVRPYYLVYVEGNIEGAKSAVDTFWNAVDAVTDNSDLRNAARKLMEGIKDMDSTKAGIISTDEKNALHNLFPDTFPMLGNCFRYAAMLEGNR